MVRELRARGPHVNPKRGARLMREAGLQGVSRRQSARTTRRDRDAPATPDLLDRDLAASGPDALWVADITYLPTWSGLLYLAVGWRVSTTEYYSPSAPSPHSYSRPALHL